MSPVLALSSPGPRPLFLTFQGSSLGKDCKPQSTEVACQNFREHSPIGWDLMLGDFPSSPVVRVSCLCCAGQRVQFLVGELKSYVPCGVARKKKKRQGHGGISVLGLSLGKLYLRHKCVSSML